MAVGIKDHFAADWQKTEKAGKNYSDTIRTQGNAVRETTGKEMARAESVQEKPQVQVEKPISQAGRAEQATRPQSNPEVANTQAAKEAAREYVQARAQAKGLGELTSTSSAQKGAEVATKQPVVNVTQVQDAFVQGQTAPRQAQVVQQAAQLPGQTGKPASTVKPDQTATRQRAADKGKPEQAEAKGKDQAEASKTGLVKSDASLAAGARIDKPAVVDAPRDWESADGIEDDEKKPADRNSSTFAVGNKSKSARRELGALLGGSAGQGGDSETGGDAEKTYAIDLNRESKVEHTPLSERDSGFKVYSEFDSEKTGPETYAAAQRLLETHVLKRLGEIAQFDQRLDEEIKSAFENTPLSKRIIGDIDIEVGKFTGSVYGEGMISG